MKIVLIAGWYFPDSVGGTETYVHMLAKDLQIMGHEVRVAAPLLGDSEENYIYDDIRVYRYPVSNSPSFSEIRGEPPPEYFGFFSRWIQHEQPDVVHQHSYTRGCGLHHAEYVKSLNIPLVFTAHVPGIVCNRGTLMRWGKIACDGQFYQQRCTACVLEQKGLPKTVSTAISILPDIATNSLRNIENSFATIFQIKQLTADQHRRIFHLFSISDKVVSVAQWMGQMLLNNGLNKQKLVISRHGLIPVTNRTNISKSPKFPLHIGYIGRFDRIKGIHIIIEAIKRLSPLSKSKLKLYVYGKVNNSDEKKYLEVLNKLIESEEAIVLAGEVTNQNRDAVMNNIDILAIPSICLETGPLVVLEAFAAGVPVIGSNLGGIAENVQQDVNGILVEAGNVTAWTRAFEKLADNPEIISKLQAGILQVRSSRDQGNRFKSISWLSKGFNAS